MKRYNLLYILGLFLIFPSVVSAAGRCCYYSYNEPSVSAGQDLICGYDDDGDGEDSPYHCQITSQGAQQCGSSLSWGDCPPANTFSSYYNFLGAHYTEHTTCPPITEFEDMAVYSHSILGSNAEGVCAYLQSDGEPDPSFGAMWTEAESKIITTGVHMVKCLCHGGAKSGSDQSCQYYEDAQLDFDRTSETEEAFQTKYATKCNSFNDAAKKCSVISGYTKDSQATSDLPVLPACNTDIDTANTDCPSLNDRGKDACDMNTLCFWSEKLKCVSKFDGGICKDLTEEECKKSENCGWSPDQKTCVSKSSAVVDAYLKDKYAVPPGYNGPLPPCAFSGTCNDVNQLLEVFLNYARMILAGVAGFAFAFFAYGGFLMIFSFGNAERVKKGQQVLVAAVVGLAIVFSAYIIVNFVLDALGVEESFRGIT